MLNVEADLKKILKMRRWRSRPDAAQGYQPPPVIERRWEYVWPLSDQGKTSRCASEALCTEIEKERYSKKGLRDQLDAARLYRRVLELEYETNEDAGSSLFTPPEAAAEFDWIEPVGAEDMRVVYDKKGDELRLELSRLKHRYNTVLSGLDITEAWLKAGPDGWIPEGTFRSLGGHGVPLAGYRWPDYGDEVAIANSWGSRVAWNGFKRMKWAQFSDQHIYSVGFDIRLK